MKSDRVFLSEEATANYQMPSICNSAPLFLLARTPGSQEEAQPGESACLTAILTEGLLTQTCTTTLENDNLKIERENGCDTAAAYRAGGSGR